MSSDKKTKEAVSQKFEMKKIFNHAWVMKNVFYFLFLAFLAVVYIYNGHYADKLARKMAQTEKHIKELDYEYKTIKSAVIFRSKAGELAKAVAPLGLKELQTTPQYLEDTLP